MHQECVENRRVNKVVLDLQQWSHRKCIETVGTNFFDCAVTYQVVSSDHSACTVVPDASIIEDMLQQCRTSLII